RGEDAARRRDGKDVLHAIVSEVRADDGEAHQAALEGPELPRGVLARDPPGRLRPAALSPRGSRAACGGEDAVTPTWRYIESDGVAHSTGLAADEWLMTAGGPVLRLYTYRSHCALVGKFQNLEAEIDLDFCREADIGVNRRPTGGGAILMGEGQLGIAVIHSSRVAGVPQHPKEIFARYGRAIMAGLERLGVRGDLEAKNDIRVAGRKIAGLGVCRDESGAFLFHTSLLVDLDVDLMLRVLKIPAEKISDKLRARVADNLTTVRREIGRSLPMAEVREAIREGFAAAEGVRFERRDVSPQEMDGVRRLEEEKYLQPS